MFLQILGDFNHRWAFLLNHFLDQKRIATFLITDKFHGFIYFFQNREVIMLLQFSDKGLQNQERHAT